MDNSVEKDLEEPVSLLSEAEKEIKSLQNITVESCGKSLQPPRLSDHRMNVDNLEVLLQQLILKLRGDVDKLWVSALDLSDSACLEGYEDSVTVLLQKRVWGEKETVLSCLTKLVGLLDKMMSIELELAKASEQREEGVHVPTTEDDRALIERYMAKHNEQKGDV